MSGTPDPLYVRARAALLDAAEALADHLPSITLVGAQAVYLHAGDADFAVAEYTTDADFSISPTTLADAPLIADLLTKAGFTAQAQPGSWLSRDRIQVDLMVAETLAGPGRRGAELGPHTRRVARKAAGLEAALVDRGEMTIRSLDPTNGRTVTMNVAGPAALLVAKVHKIYERTRDAKNPSRVSDKDALDVVRLLQAVEPETFGDRLRILLDDPTSSDVTTAAIEHFGELFGESSSAGVEMAIHAAGPQGDRETLAASIPLLAGDLLASL